MAEATFIPNPLPHGTPLSLAFISTLPLFRTDHRFPRAVPFLLFLPLLPHIHLIGHHAGVDDHLSI